MLRITECTACHEQRPHKARGLCNRCYKRQGDALRPRNPPTRGPRPVPAQTRCPGCPDVPTCPRAVLPGTGYCLRCGPLARVTA